MDDTSELRDSRRREDATGYVATIVAGEVTRRHDADTGARPGRLIRGGRTASLTSA